MSVNPSLPWDGRWGASVSGATVLHYPFYFQDGTLGLWQRDDGVPLEGYTWNGVIDIVDINDPPSTSPQYNGLGPAGYAMRVKENAPKAFEDDPNLYGCFCSPRFPVKPGDIVTSRLLIMCMNEPGFDGFADVSSVYTNVYDTPDLITPVWYFTYMLNPLARTYSQISPGYETLPCYEELYSRSSYTVLRETVILGPTAVSASVEWVVGARSAEKADVADLPFEFRVGGALITVTTPGGV